MAIDIHHGHPLKEGYLLSENLEMYLKSIYRISKEKKVARVKDISLDLKVSKSSVTKALKFLNDKDFIEYDPYSFACLTDKGRKLAEKISQKYELLTTFFSQILKIPLTTAQENACRVEHVIDDLVYRELEKFVESAKKNEEA